MYYECSGELRKSTVRRDVISPYIISLRVENIYLMVAASAAVGEGSRMCLRMCECACLTKDDDNDIKFFGYA